MIKQLEITNPFGEVLVLELKRPEKSGLSVLNIDGLGPTKGIINTSKVLSIPGSLFNSSTASSRNILLHLGFMGINSIEEERQKTYKYFPTQGHIKIKIITDFREAITSGIVESNEPDIFSKNSGTTISIICPDAYFKSEKNIDTLFSGVASGFSFPFSNNSLTQKLIVFGDLSFDTSASVFYEGDGVTGLMVYIHFIGPASDLTLYNINRREQMKINSNKLIALTGSGFVAGDDVIISTLKGNKYIKLIRGGQIINILNCIDLNSNWFQIQKGDNLFTFTAYSGQANVQLKTTHQELYEGV